MTKPKKVQTNVELWARYTNEISGSWGWTLYIATPGGKLEGYYNTTIKGHRACSEWSVPYFKRDNLLKVESGIWDFLGEIE